MGIDQDMVPGFCQFCEPAIIGFKGKQSPSKARFAPLGG
jgi:hypothetical protein